MTSDLDERLTRLLAEPTALDVDPDMLPRVLSRRGQLVRRRRLVLTAGALAAVATLTVSGAAVVASRSGSHTQLATSPTSPTSLPIQNCGTFHLGQGTGPDTVVPATALTCFLDAAQAGTPAVLSVSRPTTEGDPIGWTYTVEPDGSVQVLTDTRQDKFGPREVTVALCSHPFAEASDLTFSTCTSPVPTTAP